MAANPIYGSLPREQPSKMRKAAHFGCRPGNLFRFVVYSFLQNECWDSKNWQGPNLSSSQKWAFHHDSVLLQPAMNAEEFLSLRKWEDKHSGMIAFPQLTPFWHQDGVRKLLELIAENAELFEYHFCDLKISLVTECLLVGASTFFNQLVSLKYF